MPPLCLSGAHSPRRMTFNENSIRKLFVRNVKKYKFLSKQNFHFAFEPIFLNNKRPSNVQAEFQFFTLDKMFSRRVF